MRYMLSFRIVIFLQYGSCQEFVLVVMGGDVNIENIFCVIR
jgi:hypothetical protein